MLAAVGTALAGCSGADSPVVPTLVVTDCEGSFLNLDAARDSGSGVGLDDAQLYTLQMCSSRQQWLGSAANHPVALDGAQPDDLLVTICGQLGGSAAYPACQEAAGPSSASRSG